MKIIIPIILVMLIFTANALVVVGVIASIGIKPAQASEYSPLDFLSDYEDFSVAVGISKTNGRYASYHYEFSE